MLQVGDTAPDFTLPDQDGNPVSLAQFRGRAPVVLVFYPGDNTPVCTAQLCEFRDDYAHFQEAGAVVLGINPWSASSHRSFAQRHRLPFPLLVDQGCAVARLYRSAVGVGPLSIPMRGVYVMDREGRIVLARRGKPAPAEILALLQPPAASASG